MGEFGKAAIERALASVAHAKSHLSNGGGRLLITCQNGFQGLAHFIRFHRCPSDRMLPLIFGGNGAGEFRRSVVKGLHAAIAQSMSYLLKRRGRVLVTGKDAFQRPPQLKRTHSLFAAGVIFLIFLDDGMGELGKSSMKPLRTPIP